MYVLIWIVVAMFIPELVHGENNPYKEALLAQPWESEQDYVRVRPGAHMFYWLYYADGTSIRAQCKPLIIWIPGGPGNAASGIANFAEIGPLTMNMEPRNHTWVKGRNVLLFDHPVGTGFSYVRNNSLLAKTDQQTVNDLYQAIKKFLIKHSEFITTPTYIFGQGYGGKLCPILAYFLYRAIEAKTIKMNLKGIGIGSGFVNPQESMLMYPKSLYHMGMIDRHTYLNITVLAEMLYYYSANENYIPGLIRLSTLMQVVKEEIGVIDFHNINQLSTNPELLLLQKTINTYVKPMLSHVVDEYLEWVSTSRDVLYSLGKNYVVPSTKFLEMLLKESKLKVAVYNGNLDVFASVAGASNWVHKLKWNGSQEFKRATRHRIRGTNNGFYKEAKQLSLWWVFGAGHWVPEENPEAMEHILEYVMSDNSPVEINTKIAKRNVY